VRREFTAKTKGEAFLLAGGHCERCRVKLRYGEAQYDHHLECREDGDNSLENCQVLCRRCHKAKSAKARTERAKADRGFRQMANAKAPSRTPLPFGRGSPLKRKLNGAVVPRGEP
jgi:5-methylcytosine-specific restriction protein A